MFGYTMNMSDRMTRDTTSVRGLNLKGSDWPTYSHAITYGRQYLSSPLLSDWSFFIFRLCHDAG